MNCKRAKELILTDFSDGQLDQRLQKEIEEHLNSCNKCKEFTQFVRRVAIDPFRNTERIKAPEYIWHRVKNKIETEDESRSMFAGLLENFRFVFQTPKPALVMTAIAVVIIIAFVITKLPVDSQEIVNNYLEEEIDFLSQLAEDDEEENFVVDEIDLGTSVEKYLL